MHATEAWNEARTCIFKCIIYLNGRERSIQDIIYISNITKSAERYAKLINTKTPTNQSERTTKEFYIIRRNTSFLTQNQKYLAYENSTSLLIINAN